MSRVKVQDAHNYGRLDFVHTCLRLRIVMLRSNVKSDPTYNLFINGILPIGAYIYHLEFISFKT